MGHRVHEHGKSALVEFLPFRFGCRFSENIYMKCSFSTVLEKDQNVVEHMLEVITNKKEWDRIIEGFGDVDFYHFYDYHVANLKEDETAQLLFYRSGETTIAFPIIIRPIANSGYFDVTSVYGYVGPLISDNSTRSDLDGWHGQLRTYFVQNRIVSAFSSLNPFLPNQIDLLKNFGEIENLGEIVYMDFDNSDEYFKEYSKTTKRYVKRNEKLFSVREGKSEEDALAFMEIYYQSMDRIQAEPHYYFKLPYFLKLVQSKDFDASFVFAHSKSTGEIGAGALIVSTKNRIIQYHLSGTSEKFRHLSPIRTVIDHVRQKGTINKFKYFNLGGGVGSSNDSLFGFKASFSRDSVPFKVWKYITDQKVYDELCEMYPSSSNMGKPNYFPKYRSNLKNEQSIK